MRARYEQIAHLVDMVLREGITGDFAEFGVWQGTTFLPLAESAAAAGRRCHAVDSFQGCSPPGPRDLDAQGVAEYSAGALSVGGSTLFRQLVAPLGSSVRIWEGWIPAVLEQVGTELTSLAFAHVDLDQYDPSLTTLRWCWERLSPGGVLSTHDWFAGATILAGGAWNDWLAGFGLTLLGGDQISVSKGNVTAGVAHGNHAWVRKEWA